jgi:myo-inositol catabolism protein IolC
MKHTAGVWDRSHWPLYFMAANPETLRLATLHESDNLLMAVNEVMASGNGLEIFEGLCNGGRKVFLDSRVYWLATQHAEANNMNMNEALGLAPERVQGFDQLFNAYVDTARRYEQHLWGYIEIDQGGRENKTRTRARLEDMGLRPIPVYHPLNDGWDYFDELASQYDRICLGNVVMANSAERKRLAQTINGSD